MFNQYLHCKADIVNNSVSCCSQCIKPRMYKYCNNSDMPT